MITPLRHFKTNCHKVLTREENTLDKQGNIEGPFQATLSPYELFLLFFVPWGFLFFWIIIKCFWVFFFFIPFFSSPNRLDLKMQNNKRNE